MDGDLRPPGGEVEAAFWVELAVPVTGLNNPVPELVVTDALSNETVARLRFDPTQFAMLFAGATVKVGGTWTSSPMRLGLQRHLVAVDVPVQADVELSEEAARRWVRQWLESESRAGRLWSSHRLVGGPVIGWQLEAYRWEENG